MKLKQFQGIEEGEDMGVEAERSYLKHDRAYQSFNSNKKLFVFPCFVLISCSLAPIPVFCINLTIYFAGGCRTAGRT
jgi:hypothetical protein